MMYSQIILLKCILLVICAAQEQKLVQHIGKDKSGSYTYSLAFANDNKGEYGHKIEVKNGNSKDNSNTLKVKNSGLVPKPFAHETKAAPLSKPNEANFGHVSKHQQSPQQYQPSRRPNQVTLDKNQLAILLAQNKNPYLLSEKDRNIISQQAAHFHSFPYQVSDIQLTSQYLPTPNAPGNAQSNHLSQPQQVVASKPEFKNVYVSTQQQTDLSSKKYADTPSSIQQQPGEYPKEYFTVLSQPQNHQELPQFSYSSPTAPQKLFVPTPTQQESGYTPSNNGAPHHNLQQSYQTQQQTGSQKYSGIQNQKPQKYVYVTPSNEGATQFKQQPSPIQHQEYAITTQNLNQNLAHQFVYATPASTPQNNLQFSYPMPQHSSLYPKEYSGLTSQMDNQQDKFVYLIPQGSPQTQQQFDSYSKQGVQDFAYSNNAATQQIPVSSAQQPTDYSKEYSYVFPQVQTQEAHNFAYLYPSNGKTTQQIPVSSPSQQTQYQQVQYSSNGGGSHQTQYNPSGQVPQHSQSSATYQIPQHAAQGQQFVFTPQNQPMQNYLLVAPTTQAVLPQSTSFPQHSITQPTYLEQLTQQPQPIVSHPSSQPAYSHIPQGSTYNVQQNQQIPNNNYYSGNPSNIGDLKIQEFTEALANYGKKYETKQVESANAKPVSNTNQGTVGPYYNFASANNKDINSGYTSVLNENYENVNNAPNKAYNFKSQHTYHVHEPASDANVKYVYYIPSNAPVADESKKA